MITDLRVLANALGGEISGTRLLCPGPDHSAADRSLSIKLDSNAPDGFVVHSFAGDDPIICKDYVRAKAGLPAFAPNGKGKQPRASDDAIERALMAVVAKQTDNKPKGKIVATYDYKDAGGALLYQNVRYEPKDFRQRRPDGNGGWIWKLNDVRRALYRWPQLIAFPDATVFICEGEKDADRVASLDLCATTVASGKWTNDCINALAGRHCWILEDNDDTGRKKALETATRLHPVAAGVKIVRFPSLPDGGDVSDWLDMGHTKDDLEDFCYSAPDWEPNDASVSNSNAPETEAPKPEPVAKPPLPFINMSNWDNEPVPEQEWAVPDRIPLEQTALFTGEGGYGKSTILEHLCAAHALGRDWLGSLPEPGPAIFLEAEDGKKPIHRRLASIARLYSVTFQEMIEGGLHLVSLFGDDTVLAGVSRSGKIEPTTRYTQLLQAAGDIKPKMIGIASSANVFAGSENDRSQTQQFVNLLNRVAMVAHGSVVLVSHPSLTGINTDSGLSGTTQWHNAVRARFYIKGINPEPGEQPDDDLRELIFKKNQYGRKSAAIMLRYRDGLFLPERSMSGLDKVARDSKAEEVFLDLLKRLASEGRNVSHHATSKTYAPTTFTKETEAKTHQLRKADFENAMRRLFEAKKIHVENYGRPSRPHTRIILKKPAT